jgi:uncharacterized protein (TIGR04222 family)
MLLLQLNPLNFAGPKFLLFYIITLIAATFIASRLRGWLIRSGEEGLAWGISLDPYEAATLRNGAKGAIETAIAMLVHHKAVETSKAERQVKISGPLPQGAHWFERAVYNTINAKVTYTVAVLHKSQLLLNDVERITERLKEMGLLLSDKRWSVVRTVPTLVMAAVLALGFAKIVIGVSRDRPVGALVFLSFITVIITLIFLNVRPETGSRGKQALKDFKAVNAALQATARTQPQLLSSPDLALAVGLFGVTSLGFADAAWADLQSTLAAPSYRSSSSSSSCGSSSCSSSSCSSSSCSSSSCGSSCGGGGGCGGCGG